MSTGSGITITFSTNPITVEMQPGGDVGQSSDELVKYDVNDPTAGYLGAKIVAGTNITVSEGTGADENKVLISLSGTIDGGTWT